MRRRTSLPLVLTLLAGCADAPAGTTPEAAQADSIHATVDLAIGTDGDATAEFGRIAGLAVDDAGRVYVADALNYEIRVFGPDGSYRYRIGRRGSGPGELLGPCCLAFDPAGRLYVRDGPNHRYAIFQPGDTAAAYVGQVEMVHGDVNRWVPTTFDPAGRLIDTGTVPVPGAASRTLRHHLGADGRAASREPLHEVPADSTGMRQVQRKLPVGDATLFFYPPFAASAITGFARDGDFAHALSSRYAIDWRDDTGALRVHVTAPAADGPALSGRERQIAEEAILDAMKRSGLSRLELGFGIPDRKPVLRSLFFDAAGRLWVELAVPDGSPRKAHVYTPDGARVATVTWPAQVRSLDWIGDDVAWGTARDSLDVPALVRLRLPGAGALQ